MDHLEIEFKTLLDEDEFVKLLPSFSKVSPVKQTNHYFDTSDWQLKQLHSSLRIRTFENHAELTLKISQKIGNMEYNHSLTINEAHKILAGEPLPSCHITTILKEHGISPDQLIYLGQLSTIRREIHSEQHILALDESHYFDKIDYELEMEVQEAITGKQAFSHFLEEHGIQYKAAKSKIARFAQNL